MDYTGIKLRSRISVILPQAKKLLDLAETCREVDGIRLSSIAHHVSVPGPTVWIKLSIDSGGLEAKVRSADGTQYINLLTEVPTEVARQLKEALKPWRIPQTPQAAEADDQDDEGEGSSAVSYGGNLSVEDPYPDGGLGEPRFD